MRRFLGLGKGKRTQGLIPESRRIENVTEGREKKKKRKNDGDSVQDVVKLGGGGQGKLSTKVEAEVRAENDQEVYQYEMPKAELGFGDMLKDHQPGERMPGIAISKKSSQPQEAIMRELEQFQPDIDRRFIKLPKKFIVQLVNQEEKISLDQVFTRTNPKYPYILIRKIMFVLTPLSSFFDDFTNVNAMILDTRILNRPKRQTAVLNSNVDYRGSVSLDYCFPISSLPKFFLYLQLEVQLMEAGEEWGTMMIKVEAEEMDFPVMEEFRPVSIVAQLPPSGLAKYKYDPTHMDLTIRDSHRKKLLDMYENGDLADTTKPIVNKTAKARYTSTTVKDDKGAVLDSSGVVDWRGVNKAGRQGIDEVSIDPEDSGSNATEEIPLTELRLQALELQRRENKTLLETVSEREEEQESLSGLEKQALENMAQNSQAEGKVKAKSVGFLVKNVRGE